MPTETKPTTAPAPTTSKPLSKSALVLKLLSRAKGATIAEMEEPTGWQPHSTRAFLSGLRKKGMTVAREPRKTGETAYRIATTAGPAAVAPTPSAAVPEALASAPAAEAAAESDADATTNAATAVATEATV